MNYGREGSLQNAQKWIEGIKNLLGLLLLVPFKMIHPFKSTY